MRKPLLIFAISNEVSTGAHAPIKKATGRKRVGTARA